MNFDYLKGSGIVRLRPKVVRQFPDGHFEEIDDEWKIEEANRKTGIELSSLRSAMRLRLYEDHVHGYTSDPRIVSDDVKRGFLTVTVKIMIDSNNDAVVEPLPLNKTATSYTAVSSVTDPWVTIISRYAQRESSWEHFLTCDFIEEALETASNRLKELHSGLIYKRVEVLSEERVFEKHHELIAEVINISDSLDPTLRMIPQTWGPPGVAGDLSEIRRACQRLRDLINALVESTPWSNGN